MEELIKFVRTYRMTTGVAERLRLAEEIFRLIEPDLRLFVFSNVSHAAGQDALQEILKTVATSPKKFRGDTAKEFLAWCLQARLSVGGLPSGEDQRIRLTGHV